MSTTKKALIVYFSMGGSTAKIADAIASGLRSAGYNADLHSLREGASADVSAYQLVGIGSPVFYYRQPFIVSDYLRSLPNLGGLPVFTFNTFAEYRWDASRELRKVLTRKGATYIGYTAFRGAGTFLPYAKLGYEFSPDDPKPDVILAATRYGVEVAERATRHEVAQPEAARGAPFIYRLERFASNRWLTRLVYWRFFSADGEECNKCGLCIKTCPMNNIRKDADGRPHWARNCLLCCMCESRCTRDAIRSPLDWRIFRPFQRYNVRAAVRDGALEHARVRHLKGRTERV